MNILLIHSHDTGKVLSPYGASVDTPSFEELAKRSVTFDNVFAAAPTCSPSRASIFSGLYPHQCAMTGLAHRGFQWPDYSIHIVPYLSSKGVRTVLCGVQHVAPRKADIGYDEILDSGEDYFINPDIDPLTYDKANSNRVAAFFRQQIKNEDNAPFFLSLGLLSTHRPFPDPLNTEDIELDPRFVGFMAQREDFSAFSESLGGLDRCLGKVLEALDESGLADRTTIIFTTDHGPAFPGIKGTLSDGGTGVALMLAIPPKMEKASMYPKMGTRDGRLTTHLDIVPTIVDLLDLPLPSHLSSIPEPFRGLNLRKKTRGHTAVFSESNYHAAYEPVRSVRTPEFRYLKRFGDFSVRPPANTDPSISKDAAGKAGYFDAFLPERELYRVTEGFAEGDNLTGDAGYAVMEELLDDILNNWMSLTDDPLSSGVVQAPPGSTIDSLEAWDPT